MTQEKHYLFEVSGGWTVVGDLKPSYDAVGNICGIELPDGRMVRLIVALEVEDENGEYKYVTSEKEMEDLGFESLDYNKCDFVESDESIQDILNDNL